VRALCADEFSRLLEALPQQPPEDPIEGLRQLGLAYARFGLAHPNHYRFMFMTAREPHEHSDEGQRAFGLLLTAVERAVQSGRVKGGDTLAMAQVLWSSIHGVIALLITYLPAQFPQQPPVADLIERVVENGINGFLTDPSERR